jgi:transposase-like protein
VENFEKISCLRCGKEASPYAPIQTLIRRYACPVCGFEWEIVTGAGMHLTERDVWRSGYQYGHDISEGTLLVLKDEKFS